LPQPTTPPLDLRPIVCRGAPRDMGADEGRALAARQSVQAGRRRSSPAERRALRDLRRHIPQQAERLIALAEVLGLPPAILVAEVARDAQRIRWGPDGHPFVPTVGGQLRRSLPDAGFSSLEWQPRETAAPALGVNPPGLRVLVVRQSAAPRDPRSAAPATFLLPEVLQRFADARVAADWLARRPASGTVRFFLADAGRADWLCLSRVGERCAIDAAERVPTPPASEPGIELRPDGIGWRHAKGEFFYPVSHQCTASPASSVTR
jgi:hypothetical protein